MSSTHRLKTIISNAYGRFVQLHKICDFIKRVKFVKPI